MKRNALMLSTLVWALSAAPYEKPRGVYVVLVGASEAPEAMALLTRPEVDGVTFYQGWRTFEPQEGAYQWESFDQVLLAAEKTGKRCIFSLNAGNWISNWVYEKGVKALGYRTGDDYMTGRIEVSDHRSPVPWDPVFLGTFSKTIRALGGRYGTRTNLVAVNVTGPAPENGLEPCMSMGGKDEALVLNGFTYERFAGAWETMIDVFSRAFPQKRLTVCTHDMFGSARDGRASAMIHQYGFSNLAPRYGISALFVTHDAWFEPSNESVKNITAFAGRGHTGMQLIRKYMKKNLPAADFEAALEKAQTIGRADWVEVFKDDALYAPYREILSRTHQKLLAMP
ncbi:MAG: beta-galactosidase [Spirochaetes bacterium]|nr:beta-galactosidase [Spirochaetota bacterium]